MLYSDELKEFDGVIPEKIEEAIQVLCRYYSISKRKILSVDENRIAIPAIINVSIPPGGTIGGIDIRDKEPVLFRFNLEHYPDLAPVILSDRKDFPKHNISHLYASRSDDPAAKLCLVRGSPNEWFSRKRLENFLEVADEWFFKAANGKLNDDGDEFDPLRLDSYCGYHIYRYNQLQKVIDEKFAFLPGQSFACFITMGSVEMLDGKVDTIFKTELPVQLANINLVLENIKKLEEKKGNEIKGSPFLSVLVWSPENNTYEDYETEFPKDYKTLQEYFKKYGIEIELILKELIRNDYIWKKNIPIIHAIKRPKKVIGFDGSYEFVNFKVFAEANKSKFIDANSKVSIQCHIEPFTSDLAQKLAGENRNQKILFVGAGSLGSKIILHNGRSGSSFIGICDEDDFLQHNLARHGLLPIHVGRNKSNAIVDELDNMFEFTPEKSIKSYPYSVTFLPDTEIAGYNWLIDSTASLNVRNWLAVKNLPAEMNVARCELADEGRLGLLYIEGSSRNPRIDDLVNLAYFKAMKYPALEKWRRADELNDEKTLSIGLGCSSVTSVMADDTISIHAALFSKILYNEKSRSTIKNNGLFYFQAIENNGISETYTKYEVVSPFSIYHCRQGSAWEVRMMHGISDYLLSQCKRFKPNETGGVLIGVCNYKTRTIHIYDALNAPPNSKRSPASFVRGNIGLPQQVDEVKEKTGGIIGYVGEWHTHPMQLEAMSQRDIKTVQELLPINRQVPIPTLSLIVTNTDLLPFIFL